MWAQDSICCNKSGFDDHLQIRFEHVTKNVKIKGIYFRFPLTLDYQIPVGLCLFGLVFFAEKVVILQNLQVYEKYTTCQTNMFLLVKRTVRTTKD